MGFLPAGERNPPFKGRWHSGLQAPNYRAEQRPGRREKDFAKQQFYAVFAFSCKKQGIATAGCVPIATHGCMATVGCVQLQPIDALQLPVGFRLQLMDAWQPWVCFRLQPLVVFGTFGKIMIPRRSRGFFLDGRSPLLLATRHVALVRSDTCIGLLLAARKRAQLTQKFPIVSCSPALSSSN